MPDRKKRLNEVQAGSPSIGEPEYLVVGKLRRPHGVNGEILMDVQTDFPERLRIGSSIWVGDQYQKQTITAVRGHGQGLLIRLKGFDSVDAVGIFRNQMVYVPIKDLPALPEGEYYHHQLIGLQVIDEQGESLGLIKDILLTGANDVYVVESSSGKEVLLPAIADVILKIDLSEKIMQVHLLPGLIDDSTSE